MLKMSDLFLNNILPFGFTFDAIFYILLSIFAIITSTICYYLFTFVRPRFPVRVNCWFCNKNFNIPYNDRKCWQCPQCEQYNGFSQDGDYNTDVQKKIGSFKEIFTKKNSTTAQTNNGLCETCNNKLSLKVQQLATFTPMREENYDVEIEHFRKQLENWYKLCKNCETVLGEALQTQNYNLLTNRLNNHRKDSPDIRATYSPPMTERRGVAIFRDVSILILSLLTGASVVIVVEEYSPISFSDYVGISVSQMTSIFFHVIFNCARELTALGMTAYFLAVYGKMTRKDELLFVMWGVIGALSWTNYCIALLAFCVVSLLLSIQFAGTRKPQFYKREPLKQRESCFNAPTVKPLSNLSNVISNSMNKTQKEKNQQQIDKLSSNVIDASRQTPVKKKENDVKVKEVANKVQTRSQTMKNQQEISGQPEKRGRLYSPPPEFYESLKSLHIAPASSPKLVEKEIKAKTTATKWQGLKPTKFGTSLASNFPGDEGDSSRSSTPSSGYGSQSRKISETTDIFQNGSDSNFALAKTVSPVYSKFTPPRPYGFDCDCNPYSGFFSTGYTPPYQPFSSPLGHTTVYTYTRPANFPYGFPSQRFSPVFDQSSAFSPRMSEINDSKNSSYLFQNHLSSDRWSWTKLVTYGSIGFNCLSAIILAISYWR